MSLLSAISLGLKAFSYLSLHFDKSIILTQIHLHCRTVLISNQLNGCKKKIVEKGKGSGAGKKSTDYQRTISNLACKSLTRAQSSRLFFAALFPFGKYSLSLFTSSPSPLSLSFICPFFALYCKPLRTWLCGFLCATSLKKVQ